MKNFILVSCCMFLLACSSTSYESSALIKNTTNKDLSSVTLYIDTRDVILASQANERLFKLHHNHAEVHEMINNIATKFGFQLSNEADAEYKLLVYDAKPDGGECLEGFSSFSKGLTFTFSVMTLGVLPATNGYCFQLNTTLFYRPEIYGELSPEMTRLADFSANEGRVNVVAGANEVDNYQRTVTIEDEARALETTIVSLFADMIEQGAFD